MGNDTMLGVIERKRITSQYYPDKQFGLPELGGAVLERTEWMIIMIMYYYLIMILIIIIVLIDL